MKRPPYLIRVVSRHGTAAYYFWRRPGPRIRIKGEYGSRPFMAAYKRALLGKETAEQTKSHAGTLAGLISGYRQSPQWNKLAPDTRRQRSHYLDKVIAKSGDMLAADVDKTMVIAARDSMKSAGSAKWLVDTLRGLFRWAKESGQLETDPTEGVKVSDPKTDGFHTWSDAEIERYCERWEVGTRERLWLAILLYTGLRRSDAVKLSAEHISDGVITLRTQKRGVQVSIPLLPDFKHVLDASQLGERTLIGLSRDTFSKAFKRACVEAGVEGSPHGLRKAAATRLAEAGASMNELNAWFAWSGGKMALIYTDKADRARLSRQAAGRLNVTTSKGSNANAR